MLSQVNWRPNACTFNTSNANFLTNHPVCDTTEYECWNNSHWKKITENFGKEVSRTPVESTGRLVTKEQTKANVHHHQQRREKPELFFQN